MESGLGCAPTSETDIQLYLDTYAFELPLLAN
jgi:hypothetical protein